MKCPLTATFTFSIKHYGWDFQKYFRKSNAPFSSGCSMGEAVNSQVSFGKATLKMSGSLFSSHTDGHYQVLLKVITREQERLGLLNPSRGQHLEVRGCSHLLLPVSIPNSAAVCIVNTLCFCKAQNLSERR